MRAYLNPSTGIDRYSTQGRKGMVVVLGCRLVLKGRLNVIKEVFELFQIDEKHFKTSLNEKS